MTLAPGTRLGPYEIMSPLGAGGMGEVYRARDTKLDRDVAIKVLPAAFANDAAALARFEREAKAVAALSHPNILAVHDFGRSGETTYAVMELLEGESLRQRIAEGPLPPRKAVEIAREVALGLAAAHEKGIVHRDLKPENLFLTRDGRVKILDFGLARQIALPSSGDTHSPTAAQISQPGAVLGTVGYMAPEQLRGHAADQRSDIFSLGAVLYETLCGRRAFTGDTAIETMNAILKDEPAEISSAVRPIPPALERIVSHCLEKKPEERFQSARDLAFGLASLSSTTPESGAVRTMPASSGWPRRLAIGAVAAAALALAFLLGERIVSGHAARPVIFRRLTFRRGNLLSARFTPDGQTVVYGAAWEGKPSELFSVRTDSVESRPLGLDHANVLSVSSKGELAVILEKGSFQLTTEGTLARVPLGGGAARELQDGVLFARWAPDGENLAVVRRAPQGKQRLEYPIGHTIEESFFLQREISLSPSGDAVAFYEWNTDNQYAIWISDVAGHKREITRGWREIDGLAWSQLTGELLFVGARKPGEIALHAVSRSGRERTLWPGIGNLYLHDVAADGRLLVERFSGRRSVVWVPPGGTEQKELGWLDGTELVDLSRDGGEVLFREIGEGAGPNGGAYLRRTDGSPAVRLGDGDPMSLSPDGKWVLTLTLSATPDVVLLPTGSGSPRKVPVEGVKPLLADFIGDGRRIAIRHSAPGEPPQTSVVGLEGGRPKSVPVPGALASAGNAFSSDGEREAYPTAERRIMIVAIAGGSSRAVPAFVLEPNEYLSGWSGDGRFLIVQTSSEIPARVSRIDVETGQRTLWKEVRPSDPAGVIAIHAVHFTADGTGYAYGYVRGVSDDLYLVEGLR